MGVAPAAECDHGVEHHLHIVGDVGGTEGVDHSFAVRHGPGIGGGPTIVRDSLAADLIDTIHVVQVPILLGRGVRLWEGIEGGEERYDIEAVSSPSGVTRLSLTRR